MEPASNIIASLGGDTLVSQAVGVHRTRVANWKRPRSVGGTGGMIPLKHIPALIRFGEERGVALTANDFLPVAPSPAHEGEAA